MAFPKADAVLRELGCKISGKGSSGTTKVCGTVVGSLLGAVDSWILPLPPDGAAAEAGDESCACPL